jgi:hypothetical protein
MHREKLVLSQERVETAARESPVVGEIAQIDDVGRPHVVFPGNEILPTVARSTLSRAELPRGGVDALLGASVLLLFEQGDVGLPIIVGFVSDRLPIESLELGEAVSRADADVDLDGRRVVLEGQQERLPISQR